MKIGLDFDGVIANSHPVKVIVAKEKFGVTSIPVEDFRIEIVLKSGLLTMEQYIAVGREAMDGSHPIPLVPDVIMYLRILLKEKHSIRVVTSRTEKMLESAEKYLADKGLNLSFQGTGYGLPKTEACQDLDLYIDDDLEKLLPLRDVVQNLLFFSWPWNKQEEEPDGIYRVSSWYEIYNYIRYEI